ncbi:MAG: family 10 glycosylhydrolase [Candidatus Fermentibacteraceae bacterium]|nr:family 10 glycosylhydrolase [Candidatus Fermentibacteraceae bacterium]MBN2609334.1 family 10 glycosylhydrolase [Candidatus Fermentibacteraceae bacterium]
MNRIAILAAIAFLVTISPVRGQTACPSRYFWVVRDGLSSPQSIDSLVEKAMEAGANGLIVQVVGRAEAYYNSSLLPEAAFQEGFDPLAYIIARARPRGMEVHAWINAFLVWSAPSPPEDSSHVWHSHPDWFMTDRFGRSTRDYTAAELEASGLVGGTLSPALPEVGAFIAGIASEIATGYDVDGIHLDYIRYPNPSFGFEPQAVGVFFLETGMDPMELFRRHEGMEELSGAWNEWRREKVTATVETIRSVLRSNAPGVLLSAAVMADPLEAETHYSCEWRYWLESGLVDFVCPMAYTTSMSRARELAALVTVVEPERVVYGIGTYNQSISSAVTGASEALSRGAGGVCVFSLNTLSSDSTWKLRNFWGETGSPDHPMDASVFHRVSSGSGATR